MSEFEWINRYYGLNVQKGTRVKAYGAPGTVIGSKMEKSYGPPGKVIGHRGAFLTILLDGSKNPGNFHPTDGIEYLDGGEE